MTPAKPQSRGQGSRPCPPPCRRGPRGKGAALIRRRQRVRLSPTVLPGTGPVGEKRLPPYALVGCPTCRQHALVAQRMERSVTDREDARSNRAEGAGRPQLPSTVAGKGGVTPEHQWVKTLCRPVCRGRGALSAPACGGLLGLVPGCGAAVARLAGGQEAASSILVTPTQATTGCSAVRSAHRVRDAGVASSSLASPT